MYHLPDERKARLEKALQDFESVGKILICEPCDCGSQVRHNNGGNYHQIIEFARVENAYYVLFDSTCELEKPPQWDEITREKVVSLISEQPNL